MYDEPHKVIRTHQHPLNDAVRWVYLWIM
jgi:hypothetical protein